MFLFSSEFPTFIPYLLFQLNLNYPRSLETFQMLFRYLQPSLSVLEVYQGFFFTMWFKSFDVMLVCYSLYWNPFHIHALPLHAWTVTLMVSVILQLCPAVVFYSPSDCLLLLSSLVHSCPLVMYHTVWFGTPIRLVSVTVWLIILYWYWLYSPPHIG